MVSGSGRVIKSIQPIYQINTQSSNELEQSGNFKASRNSTLGAGSTHTVNITVGKAGYWLRFATNNTPISFSADGVIFANLTSGGSFQQSLVNFLGRFVRASTTFSITNNSAGAIDVEIDYLEVNKLF